MIHCLNFGHLFFSASFCFSCSSVLEEIDGKIRRDVLLARIPISTPFQFSSQLQPRVTQRSAANFEMKTIAGQNR